MKKTWLIGMAALGLLVVDQQHADAQKQPSKGPLYQQPSRPNFLKKRPRRPGGVKSRILTVRGRRGFSVRGNTVRWKPMAGVRRAHYKVYLFKRSEFFRYVGKPPVKRPVRLRVLLRKIRTGKNKVPVGTIHTTTYRCKILGRVGVKPRPRRPKPAKIRMMTLRGRGFSVRGNTIRWNPMSGVRRAHYKVYLFNKSAFYRRVGTLPLKRPVKVRVLVREAHRGKHNVPAGTIRTTYYRCKILSLVGAKPRPQRPKGRVLTLRGRRGFSVRGDIVRWNPMAGVRRAHYKVYLFKKSNFFRHVGKLPLKRPVKVRVLVRKARRGDHNVPAGTIRTTYYVCKILRRVGVQR